MNFRAEVERIFGNNPEYIACIMKTIGQLPESEQQAWLNDVEAANAKYVEMGRRAAKEQT